MFQRIVNRLHSLFGAERASGRALQLQLDADILLSLIPSRSVRQHPEQKASAINRHLHTQIRRVLSGTQSALHDTSRPIPESLRSTLAYVPYTSASTLKDAGNGLFIRGKAPAASLLAIYPGMVYMPSQLASAPPLSDLAIARYDGVVIDAASDVALSVSIPDRCDLEHPFASGHYINHGVPNALQFMFDISSRDLPPDLDALIPVENSTSEYRLSSWGDLAVRHRVRGVEMFTRTVANVKRMIVVIATREVCDEEVFINYRFSPFLKWPEWYTDIEPEVTKRRWHNSGAFYT